MKVTNCIYRIMKDMLNIYEKYMSNDYRIMNLGHRSECCHIC